MSFKLKIASITFFVSIILLSVSAQNLLTKPNKFINHKKEGEWSEFWLYDTVDFNMSWHVPHFEDNYPKYVVAEGQYHNGLMEGFWKEYWIIKINDHYKKGNLKAIIEYKNGVACGLDIEYYQSGKVRVLGHYEQFPRDTSFKLTIPDLTKDPSLGLMKDTTFHITLGARPINKWYFFSENGNILNP